MRMFATAATVLMWVSSVLGQATAPASAPEWSAAQGPPPAPAVEPLDQAYLVQVARRALEPGSSPEHIYAPLGLADVRCVAAVTLRQGGKALGSAVSPELPVVQAVDTAARTAQGTARINSVAADRPGTLNIEIELLGPLERIGDALFSPEELADYYLPGLDGIAVRRGDKQVLARPSQLIAVEPLCEVDGDLDHRCDRYVIALEEFQRQLGVLDKSKVGQVPPESVSFHRFRTLHIWEPRPTSQPVELIAGMRFVSQDDVGPESLRAAADDLARYLRHRQGKDGFFGYEFLPGRDMYWPKNNNWIRQAGTAWVSSVYAAHSGEAEALAAADAALAAFTKLVKPLPGTPRAGYIATPDGQHALGTTALVALAALDHPQRARYTALSGQLLEAIAAMHRPDGSFQTVFPPSVATASQDYYPGEALLAVARRYAQDRDARWRVICDRSLPFYRDYFRANRPPAFIPWHAQAWGQMARVTRLREYADFVFEMSDWLADTQMDAAAAPAPIMVGGLDVYGRRWAGISTGVYVEGLADAVRTAEAFGETARAARYREVVRKADRFILQLRFREEECFFVHSPTEVVNGVRNSPADPTLRIDHTQHALAALLASAELIP